MYLTGILPDGPDAPLGSFTALTGDFYSGSTDGAPVAMPDPNPVGDSWLPTSLDRIKAMYETGYQDITNSIHNAQYVSVTDERNATVGIPSVGGSRTCGQVVMAGQDSSSDNSWMWWAGGAVGLLLLASGRKGGR